MEEILAECFAGDCSSPINNWSRTLYCFSISNL